MASWTARVEWLEESEPTSDALGTIASRLADVHGSVGVEIPATNGGGPVTMSATVTVEAATLRRATAAALRAVEEAGQDRPGRIQVHGVEVLDTATYDRRSASPAIPPLVGYTEIAEMLGVSRQRARELATDREDFPDVVASTQTSGPLRVRTQVEAWASRWERRGGQRKKAIPEIS